MHTISKLVVILFSVFLLGSCSPVYKITHDLSPPKTPRGLVCITGCQGQLNQCNKNCSRRYDQCSIQSTQQARKELPNLLKAYPQKHQHWLNARARYQRDLEWYEFRRDMAESRRESYLENCLKKGNKKSHCRSRFGYQSSLFDHDRPEFDLPQPIRPTLTMVATKIRELRCSKSCTCDSKYRLCYTSCGGTVKARKVCIKNCAK